ncbi:hypothetical protein ERJ70_00965 [Sediminibacillus dalangtanensis]|uniref:DUF1292 domain-containing protein n=1 Tax=Sediminibacillus dalangtanensis TaxID=2729421 RepID=A0ABX7VMH3_9BACI|nr:hypothetical protein [Sediminibacillus dalangtanensis]QTM98017.1 hypothetical protein ERJ70_00965 [Sediminibacillus dalangtanensis]
MKQPEDNLETISIEDEAGNQKDYEVDAVIEMDKKEYVLYSSGEELKMKRILHEDDDEFLLDVSEEEMAKLIDAYDEAIAEETKEVH